MDSIWKDFWVEIYKSCTKRNIDEMFLSKIKHYTENIPKNINTFFLCYYCRVKTAHIMFKDGMHCDKCSKYQKLIPRVDILEDMSLSLLVHKLCGSRKEVIDLYGVYVIIHLVIDDEGVKHINLPYRKIDYVHPYTSISRIMLNYHMSQRMNIVKTSLRAHYINDQYIPEIVIFNLNTDKKCSINDLKTVDGSNKTVGELLNNWWGNGENAITLDIYVKVHIIEIDTIVENKTTDNYIMEDGTTMEIIDMYSMI